MFVVDVGGTIRIVNPDGNLIPEPFLDLSTTVALRPGQQGLLGLAFHPNYPENGRFFVDYNNLYANGQITVSEFLVSEDDPNRADERTERSLLTIDKPDPGDSPAGQESGERRRVRNKDAPNAVAAENRKHRSPVRPEIWAYGFRNPWQFAFDPETGDFYVGDVGGDSWEEINFQEAGTTAGQNYGWDWLEGSHCYPAEIEECPRQQVGILPAAEYAHGDDGCAVIGLGVYRGDAYPTLDGIYFSGEFCTGEIRGLQRDADGIWQFQNLLDTALQITGSGQDETGTLYVAGVTGQRETDTGSVWRLVSADQIPDGATTVPLGEPGQGEVEVDELGAPIDEAAEETGDAGDTAEPVNETAPVDETVTPDEAAPAATPVPTDAGAEAGDGSEEAASTGAAEEVVIGMYDMYFDPERIRIPANTDVRLVFENRGAAPHNFEIRDRDISVDVAPGETGEIVINLPPGTYKFICNVPGHKQVGMNGVLQVR